MKKLFKYLSLMSLVGFVSVGCDLQPKITHMPENIGDFISARYPALLADPDTNPDIYNSAAADYGVYSKADSYGSSNADDYVLYSNVSDYKLESQGVIAEYTNPDLLVMQEELDKTVGQELVGEIDYLSVPMHNAPFKDVAEITVGPGDTLYSISRKYALPVNDLAVMNKLSPPFALSIGQVLKVPKRTGDAITGTALPILPDSKAPEFSNITVVRGDTLYSLGARYFITAKDIAKMNNLSEPYSLSVGQVLKVPFGHVSTTKTGQVVQAPATIGVSPNSVVSVPATISSDPARPLPAISKRTSNKFSWPVRGTIISKYGEKSNGVYNDGINISAGQGIKVGAAENGVVAYAGNEVKGMGNLIIVQHSDGWMTVYAHLDKLAVRRGAKVIVGQQIGTVGKTGRIDKAQLHFEIRKGTKSYDPAKYLK